MVHLVLNPLIFDYKLKCNQTPMFRHVDAMQTVAQLSDVNDCAVLALTVLSSLLDVHVTTLPHKIRI
jgi:hypothetical protein